MSSLRRLKQGDRPGWLGVDALLRQLGFDDSREGWLSYLRQLAALAAVTAGQEEREFAELCTGWAIGTEGWKRAVAKERRHLALDSGYDATELRGLKERRWRGQLEQLLLGSGRTTGDIPSDPPDAPWKINVAIALLRECVPYAWLQEARAMCGLSSIRGQFYRREHRTA